MDRPLISEDEMVKETELFYQIFSVFIQELDGIEQTRGKLNEFQLMQVVYRAKDTMGILGWERRQTVSSIFDKYMHIYRVFGRAEADEWISLTFGYSIPKSSFPVAESPRDAADPGEAPAEDEQTSDNSQYTALRVETLSRLILEREAELLQLYREFYLLKQDAKPQD